MTSGVPSQPLEDAEVQLLASIGLGLMPGYVDPETDPWVASPFAWIRTRPSRQRSAIGEQLIAGWAGAKGLNVRRTGNSDADRVINGRRVEIKFSTLWESGVYKFQQIRNQRYDVCLLLGLSPFTASCWVVPKAVLLEQPFREGLSHQHGGAAGTDTVWRSFAADRPPRWLSEYGGTLAAAFELLAR